MVGQDFEDIAGLELPNGIGVRDAGTVHLNDKTVQFALQRLAPRWSSVVRHFLIVTLAVRFDPIGCVVLELCCAVQDELLEVVRYNEGYRMCPGKEIGCETRIFHPVSWG